MTIAAGTVIKGDGGSGGCEVENICTLSVEGSLDAVGTPTEPIVFTSINDNSVGGDTGTGSPAAGNWSGIAVSESGSIDLEDTDVSYASTGVDADTTGPAVFKSDEFASSVYEAVLIAAAATPVVEHDSSTGLAQDQTPAFVVDSSSLDLDDIGGNSVTGSGVQAVGLSGTVATSSTLTDQPGAAWDIGGFSSSDGRLDIPSGVTMTIAAGTVIKGDGGSGGCEVENICTLSVEGSLDAVGTPTEPIVFTSINDNSVGGDTGTGSPAAGNWSGIAIPSANDNVRVSDAVFEYASTALAVGELDSLDVSSTEFSHDSAAFTVGSTPAVSLLLGQLDCAPPYTSFVTGNNDWFGTSGIPGASVDFGSIGSLTVPSGLSNVWSAMTALMPLTVSVSDNSIPWTTYECPEDFEIPIPITPIIVGLASGAPFPDYQEQPNTT